MRTRLLLCAPVLALVALVALAAACHGTSVSEGRPPAEPASASSGVNTALPVEGGLASAVDASVPPVDEGMPRLAVVLDDPRLTAARERDRAHDPSGAARAVETATGSAMLDEPQACAWAYVAGRLYLQAGESLPAASAFERVLGIGGDGGSPCALAPYAALRDAEALVKASQPEAALAKAATVGDDFAAHDELRLTQADAYVVKGDRASAVPLWRAALAASPHGVRWADSSLQLARALLDGVDGPAAGHAQEALDLTTRVVVESPAVAESSDLLQLRARAAQLARKPGVPPLTPTERARQAQAWLDAVQPKRATEVADELLKAMPKVDPKDVDRRDAVCKAAIVRAQALPHGKAAASADAWGVAIDRCEGDDSLVTALYFGGKASTSAHRDTEALDRLGRVEKLFPSHRFADDARVRAAQIAQSQGDTSRYVSLLASVADAYPDGDMKGEALFRVALEKLDAHDLDAARSTLDRLLNMPGEDRALGSAGRAAYFRARVSQLAGDIADAKTRYASLPGVQPLSFYMLLAIERLRDLDPVAATAALTVARASAAPGPFLTQPHPELASSAFEHFQRLLEVGEIDAARHEASAGGLVADGVDPEVLWTVAWSYDQAGAPDLGHSFARGRLVDFRAHWPAGRWRLPWQVAYPRPWADVVTRESQAAGIPAPLTWAIMREESAFNPDAKSGASAVGLMQLLLGSARIAAKGANLVVDEDSLHRPEVSIALGARMLASMRASFSGNPSLAIAAYNCGSAPVRRWLGERGGDDFDVFVERIPYEETRNYIKRVLTSEAAYAMLYVPDAMAELYALPERASGQQPGASP
jgi:soluble lytic murein transglycosylase